MNILYIIQIIMRSLIQFKYQYQGLGILINKYVFTASIRKQLKLHNKSNRRIAYRFGNDKDTINNNRQNDNKAKEGKKQPKTIQISKEEYFSMKKFLQDIQLSMPMPDMPFPERKSKPTSEQKAQTITQNIENAETNKKQSQTASKYVGQEYFSSPQQILSFKLLKLSQPQQFGSIFEQYKTTKELSIKLLILHRFCSVGGIMSRSTFPYGNVVNRLAYQFMEELLKNMNKLEQNELEELLQLYLTLYKQQSQEKEVLKENSTNNKRQINFPTKIQQNKLEVPIFNAEVLTEDTLPLIASPSHKNTRILVLLIQMWQLHQESQLTLGKKSIQSLRKILDHYKLIQKNHQPSNTNEVDTFDDLQNYSLKDLVYIGIAAYMCNLEQYNAIPILISQINSSLQQETKNQQPKQTYENSRNKQIIEAMQHILQSIHKLNNSASPKILNQIKELKKTILDAVEKICKAGPTKSWEYLTQSEKQQQKLLCKFMKFGSNTSSALLHSSFVAIEHNLSRLSVQYGEAIALEILTHANKIVNISLTIQQWGQYWQSVMIMYKLIKLKHPKFQQVQIYSLLETFISEFNIEQCVRENTTVGQGGYIIEENLEKVENILFDCLVAYRMALPPEIQTTVLKKYAADQGVQFKNLQKQTAQPVNIQQQSLKISSSHRRILRELLNGYRKTIQIIYKCGLINSPEDPFMHNLIISCMIAQAYSNKSKISFISHLLTPNIVQLLNETGIKHKKYGTYVGNLLKKVNNM